jgi:hypothetical protein
LAIGLTPEELDLRLCRLETEFVAQALPLRYRPLQSFKTIYGDVPDGPLRNALFEAIGSWFRGRHGERAVWDGVIGRIPIFLRGDVYLVQVPSTIGDATVRLTDRIEGLPEDIAVTFTPEEFGNLGRKITGTSLAFQKLYALSVDDTFLDDIEKGLVWRALLDLENAAHSLKQTSDTQTAIFQAHQAAEKFLKVALKRAGSKIDLKSLGHNLPKVFDALVVANGRHAWLKSSVVALQTFAPDMQIRYAVLPRTIENAIVAFNAALTVCGALAQMWLFDAARGTDESTFIPNRFYVDGSGSTFYCKTVDYVSRLLILTRFGLNPLTGSGLVVEIKLGMDQSALYLEVTDPGEIDNLRRRFEWHLRNLGQQVRPVDLGIQITSGPEGSYTTIGVRVKVSG